MSGATPQSRPRAVPRAGTVRADPARTARAREDFLSRTAGAEDHSNIRRMILASWQRCRENNLDFDRVDVPYLADRDCHGPLLRCAVPILDALHEQLHDEPVSIILTDDSGLVIDRRTTSSELTTRLDAVSLAPGFSYAEEYAGTNGIGTAITSGRAAFVDGREHYAHPLGQFACAGAPIRHPTRRSVVGILDLTCWAQSSGPMLTALAAATAREIEDELRAQTGLRELTLFQEYLAAGQHNAGPLLAMNSDVVMMNDHLRTLLDPREQQALLEHAAEALDGDDRPITRTVELPSGRAAQLRSVPVRCEAGRAGAVIRVRLMHSDPRPATHTALIRGIRTSLTPPGLVGCAPAWIRCVQQASSCYEAGEPLALIGEPGSGKRALLRAVHLLHNPTASLHVFEPPEPDHVAAWLTDIGDALDTSGTLVVQAHADQLAEPDADALACLLGEHDAAADETGLSRAAITLTNSARLANSLAVAFSRSIEVPPLRHHIDDLPDLVTHLLGQLTGTDRLSLSPQALAQLARLTWPGNVTQLRGLLGQVVKTRRSGVVTIDDLPPEARASGRRKLTPIEALERDAIVQALLDNEEKPEQAARALGLSRATIYRKVKQFGISLPLAR